VSKTANLCLLEIRLGVSKVRLHVEKVPLGIEHVGPRLLNLGFEKSRVDLGDHLPFFHLGIEIGVERLDRPGNLASNQHGRDRVDGPCRRHDQVDFSPLHPRRPVSLARPLRAKLAPEEEGATPEGG